MSSTLAIVAGIGDLSDEIISLANRSGTDYVRFTIESWFSSFFPAVFKRLNEIEGAISVDPFRFAAIEAELHDHRIKQALFTGDFPRDRIWQVWVQQIFGKMDHIADENCMRYFSGTPSDYPDSVRYFLALGSFLDGLGVRALLANEVFPQLNVSHGDNSSTTIPAELRGRLLDMILATARELSAQPPNERFRLAQSAVIDSGVVCLTEPLGGTNDLIRHYKRLRVNKRYPFLVKLPSVEFDPALDQPTIGPSTVNLCRDAGIRGIVICAETTTVARREITLKEVNRLEMFLYAIPFKQLREIYAQNFPQTWVRSVATNSLHQSVEVLR